LNDRDNNIGVGAAKQGGSGCSLRLAGVAWVLTISLLIVSGVAYRCAASFLDRVSDTPITLDQPLSSFPMQVGQWKGREVEISASVLKVAGNDDYLSRLYVNESTGKWASVYVAYTARPRTMLGHRPQACYPSAGWISDSSDKSQFTTAGGRDIDCLVHRFHKPAPDSSEVVVINFYILNGTVTNNEDKFAGIKFRTPNIDGNAARYVAQVQVSSVVENSVRAAAGEMAELIISFFPDEAEINTQKRENALSEAKSAKGGPDPALHLE
jgi:EpsI family protein